MRRRTDAIREMKDGGRAAAASPGLRAFLLWISIAVILFVFGCSGARAQSSIQIVAGMASPGGDLHSPGTCPGPNPGQPCILGGVPYGYGLCSGGLPGPPSDQPTTPVPLCNFGYSGDGGAAIDALMSFPIAVAVDPSGNVYIADAGNAVVRKVDPSGNISTYACVDSLGNIYYGSNCPVASPLTPGSFPYVYPAALAVDSNGVLHIATAGNGTTFGSPLVSTLAMAADNQGNVYKLQEQAGSTPAGDACSTASYVITGGPVLICLGFEVTPQGLAVDSAGDVYTIVNTQGGELLEYKRTVDASGNPTYDPPTAVASASTTLALSGLSQVATGSAGNFLAVDAQGNLYFPMYVASSDSTDGPAVIEEYNRSTQQVTVVAGTGPNGFNNPDDANGPDDIGNFTPAVDVPLPAAQTDLNNVNGIAFAPDGSLYIADSGNNMVRELQVRASGPSALTLDVPFPQSSGEQFGAEQAVYNPGTGDFYYVSGANTVNVINAGTADICPGCERIIASIPVGFNNGGSTSTLTMALDPTRNLVYVSNTADGNLYVINGNPGQPNSYTAVGAAGLGYAGLSLLAVDPGYNEVYAAGPGSNTIVALNGGDAPQVTSAYTSLYTPIASMSVDTATHTVYAVGAASEDYSVVQELYVITPGSSGLSVETDTFPVGGGGLGSGLFDTQSIAVDPVTASVIAAGSGQYNGTDWYAWDIDGFGSYGTYTATPLLYSWQPFTASLDVNDRVFYLTDGNSNAAMVTGIDGVTVNSNTLSSTTIPVFGSGALPASPQIYDIEPDTSSDQAWISGSDAAGGGFISLWDATSQTVTLSVTIPALLGGGPLVAGGNLFVDSIDHAAYLLDHVNNLLWPVNKPQWTGTLQPYLTDQNNTVSITGGSDPIYYTTDGTAPGLSSTTQSCSSPCTVSVAPGPQTIISAIQEDPTSGTASNVVQGVFTFTSPTSLALAVSPSPALTDQSISATATLTISASTVTGTVNFAAGGTPIPECSGLPVEVNGSSLQATCPFTESTAGTYDISASFSGDALNEASNSNVVDLQVNQNPVSPPGTAAGIAEPLAINANNTGTAWNAVLNSDSSVSLVENGNPLPGVGCPAYSGLSSVSVGAIFADSTNMRVYLAMISGEALYAAYETFDLSGDCTQGPLLEITSESLSRVEMNVDVSQGNIYILNSFGAFPDSLYVLPTATWNSNSLPTPTQLHLDYSVQYGPIVIDPSTHQVFVNDLGSTGSSGEPGTYTTEGFWIYDPNYAGSASNPERVAGYMTTSGGAVTPFSAGTLLDDDNGTLILANENPNAYNTSNNDYSATTPPVTLLNTTAPGFSFFANTQAAGGSGVDILAPGNALTNIPPTAQYSGIAAADIDVGGGLVYAYAYNANNTAQPGMLIEYNYSAANPQETVVSSSLPLSAQPGTYGSEVWTQLTYDAESTQIALSIPAGYLGQVGELAVTSPLCAGGSPSLTQILGENPGSPNYFESDAVNAYSGYIYAVQPYSNYPPQTGELYYEAPASSCSASGTPAAIAAVSGGGQSAVLGQAFANPLVVKVTDAGNDPVSGATVAFSVPASGASASLSATTATTGSDGTASVTATANGIASSAPYTVTASVSGVTTPATFSLTNTQAATTLTLTPSALSLVYGQPVTLAAAISPASVDGTAPTGSVAFYDGTSALTPASTVANAAAGYTVSVPTVGSHTYAAQYLGDSNFSESALTSAAAAVVVSKASVTLSGPATQPVRIQAGVSGSISVSIAPQYSGSGIATPSGGLSCSVSGSAFACGSLLVANGTAAIAVPSNVAPGTYTVTVSYAGDGNYQAASIDISLVIYSQIVITPTTLPAGTVGTAYSATLTAAGGTGTGYKWTASSGTALSAVGLTLSAGGVISGTPTSAESSAAFTVQVTDSQNDIATQSYTLTINSAATETIQVNDPETITVNDTEQVQLLEVSDPESITVTDIDQVKVSQPSTATATALSASALASPAGYDVTFTAMVTASDGATPAGTVIFNNGTTALATVTLDDGTASYTTSSLPAGNLSITAVYNPSSGFLASTSPAIAETISSFTLNLSGVTGSGGVRLFPGQSASFSFTVSSTNGSYNEPVSFAITGLPSGVTASFSPNPVTPGASPVTVTVRFTDASLAASESPGPRFGSAAPILLALLLPLMGFGGIVRRLRRGGWLALLVLLSSLAIAGLSACGNDTGFFNQPPRNYTVTLTASSGAARNSASLNLTVE